MNIIHLKNYFFQKNTNGHRQHIQTLQEGIVTRKEAELIETIWMSDRQRLVLVSVTMVNKPEQSVSKIEREKKTTTYSVGTTLRTLHMQEQTKTQTKEQESTQSTHNTEKERKCVKTKSILVCQMI